jgi:predicted RNA methylase
MKPYYTDSGGGIVIYCGDSTVILPSLISGGLKVDLCMTDPPYGIGIKTNYRATRDNSFMRRARRGDRHAWRSASFLDSIVGDGEAFKLKWLLRFRRLVLFGANHFARSLPNSASWIVWDKTGGGRGMERSFGDAELCWVKGGNFNSVRVYRHMWVGYQRDSEVGESVMHPTQKPVEMFRWILTRFFPGVRTVVDPYMGSGPVLKAAKDLGITAVGIEIDKSYCEAAVRRLQQSILPLNGQVGPCQKQAVQANMGF